MTDAPGTLYIVATPIGNLDDMSPRAVEVLQQVQRIAAEDTRHSQRLLSHFNITTGLLAYHDFNEREAELKLIERLLAGESIALISDAGTPLINDPGYRLVRAAHEQHIRVVPIPGPSALICALSAAGLPTDRFVFEGYAPERQSARIRSLEALKTEPRTIIFYETPHRIAAMIDDAASVFGSSRRAVLARELTKKFESITGGTLQELQLALQDESIPQKGEFVVLIHGTEESTTVARPEAERILKLLMQELPLKKAAAIAAETTGLPKNELYRLGLKLQQDL